MSNVSFKVYKTEKRVYSSRAGMCRGSHGYVTTDIPTSRKETDWHIVASNGFKMNGYVRKKDAIKAGQTRGYTYAGWIR